MELAFTKNGFDFVTCRGCGSLFADPLPPTEQFERFYRDGVSARFWGEVFLPVVESARRSALLLPKITRVLELCREAAVQLAGIADVGAGHGAFLREIGARQPGARLIAIEPNAALAQRCRDTGIETLESTCERIDGRLEGRVDLVTCFEVLEHVTDTHHFVRQAFDLIKPGGAAIFTTLGCDGFDIQLLWEKSNSVMPPHHLNFCSRAGLRRLFEGAGFASVSITTPGRLDVDIVRGALIADDTIRLSRFERLLVGSDGLTLEALQRFLADHGLSSHHWIMARRATASESG